MRAEVNQCHGTIFSSKHASLQWLPSDAWIPGHLISSSLSHSRRYADVSIAW